MAAGEEGHQAQGSGETPQGRDPGMRRLFWSEEGKREPPGMFSWEQGTPTMPRAGGRKGGGWTEVLGHLGTHFCREEGAGASSVCVRNDILKPEHLGSVLSRYWRGPGLKGGREFPGSRQGAEQVQRQRHESPGRPGGHQVVL